MPIYEFLCHQCSNITDVYTLRYVIPTHPKCDSCGSTETEKIVSLTNHRVAVKPKYSSEFVEKSLPFLKSRKELKGVFESNQKESDEAKAMKVSDKIGEQIDRVIHKQLSDMNR